MSDARAVGFAVVITVAAMWSTGLAQGTAVDPSVISGRWGTFGVPLLELQSDDRGVVTGTVHFRFGSTTSVPIARGRFDPAARALRLEGHVDADTPYLIEANLEDEQTLQVSYMVGDRKGAQTMTKLTEGPDGR